MNYRMFDRDEGCDEQSNLCMREQTKSNARRLAWTDRLDRSEGSSGERTNPRQRGLPKKAKRNQQSTRLWLLSFSSSVKQSAWIRAHATNKKGASSLSKTRQYTRLVFLYSPECLSLYITTLWTERYLTAESRQYACDGCHQGTLLLLLLWLFMSSFCICANDICNRLLICNVWLLSNIDK